MPQHAANGYLSRDLENEGFPLFALARIFEFACAGEMLLTRNQQLALAHDDGASDDGSQG